MDCALCIYAIPKALNGIISVPLSINQTWSIDFMSDSLNTGRKIRSLFAGVKSLEQLIEWHGKPKAIRCDNGPEYISHALREWAQAMDIELMHNPARQANEKWLYWTI